MNQELIQSDLPQLQRERQTNTIKLPQTEQMASRAGNSFLKRWQLCYPKLTEYSRLSLSRIPKDSIKYFEISVPRHIRFAELRKKIFEQLHLTNIHVIGLLQLEIYVLKYCGKEEKLLLRSNFSSFPQYFWPVVRCSRFGRDQIFSSR